MIALIIIASILFVLCVLAVYACHVELDRIKRRVDCLEWRYDGHEG